MINPPNVSCATIARQEHILRPSIRCNLRVVEHQSYVACLLSRGVPTWAIIIPCRHEGVIVYPRQRRLPFNIPSGQNARVKVAVHVDGPVRIVPWPAEGTFTHNLSLGRPVVGDDLGRVNVDAIFVGEGGVGALPCGDATSTVTKGQGGLCDVESSKAVEEIGLASYNDIVKVCVSKLANVNLERSLSYNRQR